MAEDTKEPTVAELKKENAALTKQLGAATATSEKLEGENAKLKDAQQVYTAEAEQAKKALLDELAEVKEELATANEIVEEVTQRLENADAIQAESATHVLTFEKKQYKVLAAKVQHKGVTYDAKDLSKHQDVLKDLIGDGKGLVQLIVATKE